MEIIQRKVSELVPYAKNTKKHDKKQIANVAESIKQYGFVQPVVIDKDGVIVIGHCRVLGAKKLGLKEVPCVCVDDLTPEQVNALRIVDNKSNESEWDMDYLADELAEIDLSAFDFDFGIDLKENEPAEVVEDDYEVEVPEEPKAKLGDIYQLGRHRLMCGDSTSVEDVEKLMDGAKADMVFTDPPYALFGNSTGVAGICDDKMTRPFFLAIFQRLKENTKLFGHIYACCDWHSAFSLQAMAKQAGLTEKNLCIWDKGDGGLGAMYQQCYEMVWFFANSPLATQTIGKKKAGERTVNGKPNIWRYSRENSGSRVHNAQKPVKMVEFALSNSTDSGELVLDLFGGSGTTLIASEGIKRTCYMMELDPKYVDVIINRWEQFTGEKAVLLND
jgi:site-specific DNA-methyltransferase (adenine-specific)